MGAEKNIRIAETMRATYEKRSRQICRVFELKVHKQRLNLQQKETLKMMFVEAKWCYNYLLGRMNSEENFDIFSYKGKELLDITHRDKDGNDVPTHLSYITSSLKDRLTRFGFNYISTLLDRVGCKVLVVNTADTEKEDLRHDFISVITSFCARIYSRRKTKRQVERIIELSQKED